MKIRKSKNNKKIITIVSVIILLLVACGATYWFLNRNNNNENDNTAQTTEPEKSESDKEQEKKLEESPELKESQNNTDVPAPTTEDEETGKQAVQMVTSVDISDNVIYIRGGINNPTEFSGNCYAQLSGPNGESVKKDTTLLTNAATIDCKTISINTNELSRGSWKYTLNYASDNTEGKTNENTFEIK
ncbi:hypothetical protein EOM27_01650 [Candidatus Saccharibacteria bacterium]|nr:hypothetical protein [Candidatus Saccharibacteria bacterium]